MRGINWLTKTEAEFAECIDVLLAREHGGAGRSPEGRGGDGGVDFIAEGPDDGPVVYQYKFFPGGVASSQIRQIKHSFASALKNHPTMGRWILVVPGKVTPGSYKKIAALSEGLAVEIQIRDRVWLDDQLTQSQNAGLADRVRYGSDRDALYEQSERLSPNPVMRNGGDVAQLYSAAEDLADRVDVNYRMEYSRLDGARAFQIVPKDPLALTRSPIELSFEVTETGEGRRLFKDRRLWGSPEDIRLGPSEITNITITGTKLLEGLWEEGQQVGITIAGDQWSPWRTAGVQVLHGSGRASTHTAELRVLPPGELGTQLQVRVARHMTVVMRVPHVESGAQRLDATFTYGDMIDQPISEIRAVFRFIDALEAAQMIRIRLDGRALFAMGSFDAEEFAGVGDDLSYERALVEDLDVIERHAGVSFRLPGEVSGPERILIRCLRLMYEGHRVAHPEVNTFTLTLNEHSVQHRESFLDSEHWVHAREDSAFMILGEEIDLSLGWFGLAHIRDEDLAALQKAFDAGAQDGHRLKLRTRRRDRFRVYLPDMQEADPDVPMTTTPWGLDGLEEIDALSVES